MKIHEAAAASGLSADTIRFYERKGVLPRPQRSDNGYRDYTEQHLATLRLANGLRTFGMPLDELRDVLRVAHDGTCHELRDAMLNKVNGLLAGLERRLVELEVTRERLGRIHAGLEAMEARDERIPGLTGCDCVRLAAGSTGYVRSQGPE